MQFSEILKTIKTFDNVDIVCHLNPDADALGSMFALDFILRKYINKTVRMVCKDPVPQEIKVLFENQVHDKISSESSLVIFVDCSCLEVSGFKYDDIKNKKTLNIDHHVSNNFFADYNYVENLSSVCEIIYNLLTIESLDIQAQVANWLMAGIYFDTGALKHDNTSSKVLRVIKGLESLGGDRQKIKKILFDQFTYKELIMYGRLFSRLKLNENGVLSALTSVEEIEETGCKINKIKQAIDFMNQISEKNICILGIEKENQVKYSLRSDEKDVSKIAQLFGGGGHMKASGFMISED